MIEQVKLVWKKMRLILMGLVYALMFVASCYLLFFVGIKAVEVVLGDTEQTRYIVRVMTPFWPLAITSFAAAFWMIWLDKV